MNFKSDVFSLMPQMPQKVNPVGEKLPSNRDVYFRSKQNEIVDQYLTARFFMHRTEGIDWNHELSHIEDKSARQYFELVYKIHFYEAALIFYNIVVDLSWTLCYISAEFAVSEREHRVNFDGFKSIEEAYRLMREAEKLVTNPSSEENPFMYLKKMCPEFSVAIGMVIEFWKEFGCSDIREKYNYCKHRGKPLYSETEGLKGPRLMNLYLNDNMGNRIQCASEQQDVQWCFGLEDSISELHDFDDDMLFPYISALFSELEHVVSPSPLVK